MLILSYENQISFTSKLKSFSYEGLCTRPRFEREASGNSEIVYSLGKLGSDIIVEERVERVGEQQSFGKQVMVMLPWQQYR